MKIKFVCRRKALDVYKKKDYLSGFISAVKLCGQILELRYIAFVL